MERLLSKPKIDNDFVRRDGVPLVHYMNECPKSYNLAYLTRADSIFTEPHNYHIGMFVQSGLTEKWKRDTIFVFQMENDIVKRKYVKSSRVILTLSHLQLAFYLLFGGFILSGFCFLSEVYYGKPPKRNKGVIRQSTFY